MLVQMTPGGIWAPPHHELPPGFIPPSPPAERRRQRREAVIRERTTWRNRCYLAGLPGYIEPMEAMPFFRAPNMTGGTQDLTGLETEMLGSGAVGPTAPNSFWRLEDVNDSIGGMNLTNVNSVTFPASKIGNGANFSNAGNQALTHADNAALRIGLDTDFTFAGWLYLQDLSNNYMILSKATGTAANQFEYRFSTTLTPDLRFVVSDGSSFFQVAWSAAPSTGTWLFVRGWYDHTFVTGVNPAGSILISVNEGTAVSVAAQHGCWSSTGQFDMAQQEGRGTNLYGGLDAWLLYKGIYSTSDGAYIYNSGAGREYYSGAWH